MLTRVTVLGGGAMGTACGILLAEHPTTHVTLWCRDAAFAEEINGARENRRLLPGATLPESIEVTANRACLAQADLYVAAIPTAFLREALTELAPHLAPGLPVVSVIKGLEVGTFLRPSQIITETLGPRTVIALCGPSHAEEIALGKPASVVAASTDLDAARQVQELFTTSRFRVYANPDILGVELAGALKNVIAIAAGICDGLGYGDNAKSALVTRGIVEMTRFGVHRGADRETFGGLAGLGDLVTTCFSRHSRNRHVGECLGRGQTLPTILAEMRGVAEGVTTCRSVYNEAVEQGVDMPITAEVYRVLFENRSPREATTSLMLRPPRVE